MGKTFPEQEKVPKFLGIPGQHMAGAEGLELSTGGFVYRYRHFYRSYLDILSSSAYLESMFDEIWQKQSDPDASNRTVSLYQYIYRLSGAIKVVERWVKNGCKESAEDMAEILTQCVAN